MKEKVRKFFEDELVILDKAIERSKPEFSNYELIKDSLQRMLAVVDFAVMQFDESWDELDDLFEEYRAKAMNRI